jgi:predicted dehydrogenase
MVRIGFVGTGLIAWAHGLGLRAMVKGGVIDARISAVHDRSDKRADRFATAMGATALDSAAAVVEQSDVIFICTPTSAHRSAVDAALAAGRPIFCEKPLATDLPRAEALVAAVAAAKVPAQSGLVLRFAPVFRELRELVASGTLGRPMAAIFRDDQFFPIQGHYASQWRADVSQAGGGCLIEHSIHDLDILMFLFGEVETVAGRFASFSGHPGIEDRATATLSFTSGIEAHLTSLWHNILSRGSSRRIELFCEDGMVSLSNEFIGPLRIQTSQGTEDRQCPPPPWLDELPFGDGEIGLAVKAYVEEDRAFIDAVTSGTAPQPSLQVALAAHRLVEATYRSAATGGVPVDPR